MPFTRRTALAALTAFAAMPGMSFGSDDNIKPLRIGVIGAGWLGGSVGRCWVKAGHEVLFSTRHPEELASWVKPLGTRASYGTVQQAAEFGEVILIAVPYEAIPDIGRTFAAPLKGKIILDACNPPGSSNSPLAQEALANGAAVTTARYLPGTRVVRAFSAVDATAVEASFAGGARRLGVPIASDDGAALQTAARLVRDAGCTPVMVGSLAQAVSFQRGGPGFRANTSEQELRRLLGL
ncbi:NADPH-dependent F420 reductase [Pseudomonas sp. NPDC089734]|uniref:NADPH-dependent F420 reductase n=1 Tax=Pseudomonas sp. NPDC089734 TaxID=3364469 RepID=UPI00381814FF